MTHDIKVTGHPELIRTESGATVIKAWQEYLTTRKDAVVTVSGWTGRLSEVRSIREVRSQPNASQRPNRSDDEYRSELRRVRGMKPSERSKRLGLFKLLFSGFHHRPPTNDEIAKAVKAQEKFYVKNPRRISCDPTEWRDILGEGKCDERVLFIVENHVRQDKFAVAHL